MVDDASVCMVVIKRGSGCVFVDKNSIRVGGGCQFAQNKNKSLQGDERKRKMNIISFTPQFLFMIMFCKMDNRIFI